MPQPSPIFMITLFYLASALNIFFALFLWIKNPKNKININVGLANLFCGIYAFGCGSERFTFYFLPMYYNFAAKISWIGTLAVPCYLAFSYYISENLKHLKIKLFIFYSLAVLIVLLTWTTSLIIIPTTDLRILETQPGPLAIWARLYLLIGLCVAMYNNLNGYKKAVGFKRLQLKYFTFGLLIFGISLIIFVGLVPFLFNMNKFADWPAIVSVVWLGFTAFAIIRYRLLEIDTVIHRTVLWALVSLVIVLPVYIFWVIFRRPLFNTDNLVLSLVMLTWFYVYGWYSRYIQPKIDHIFRRRKYDYYQALSQLGQKIGAELELSSILDRLFKALKEVLYVRNILLLVQLPEQEKWVFIEVGRTGYEKTELESGKPKQAVLDRENKIYRWIIVKKKALEREQVDIDPQYADIKTEALLFFEQQQLEILVPLILEEWVIGVIGLGKKENLQAYTIKDVELLEQLGMQIGVTLDNSLRHKDIVNKERLAEELRLGREIQNNLLPKVVPEVEGLRLEGLMIPAEEIGGDYYDFIALPQKDSVAIVIGDVSGRGVPAGLIMATAKATLKGLCQQGLSPREILAQANNILYEYTQGDNFMTMLFMQWNAQQKRLLYSSAGHEHIIVYRQSEGVTKIEALRSGGFMLGLLPTITWYLEDVQLSLNPKDKVILYTDGITESRNTQGNLFTMERLLETVRRYGHKPLHELMESIKDEVYGFIGTCEQYDDITLVAMEAA